MSGADRKYEQSMARRDAKNAAKRARQAQFGRDGKTFVPLTHAVMESPGYLQASHLARAFLAEFCYPLFLGGKLGRPNGGLMVERDRLVARGWNSNDTVRKLRLELESCGLIVETRKGGKNRPSLYAVTWLALGIDDSYDLDIDQVKWGSSHRGLFMRPPETETTKRSRDTTAATAARQAGAARRRAELARPCDDPIGGTLDRLTVRASAPIGPSSGLVGPETGKSPGPPDGHSLEHCHLRTTNTSTHTVPGPEPHGQPQPLFGAKIDRSAFRSDRTW